jgi:hypothetical protein
MKLLSIKSIIIVLLIGLNIYSTSFADANQKKPKDEDKLKKIMVMFLRSNYEKRKIVEDEITYYINNSGFEALQSIRYLPEIDTLTPEHIIKSLEDNGFDGLLVIEIVDVDLKEKRVNAKMTYGPRPNVGYPFMVDYFSIYFRYSEGYERIDTSFELETSLFRLEDKSLIYSNTSSAYDKGDIDLALEGFAKSTARKLKSSKTLLKTK